MRVIYARTYIDTLYPTPCRAASHCMLHALVRDLYKGPCSYLCDTLHGRASRYRLSLQTHGFTSDHRCRIGLPRPVGRIAMANLNEQAAPGYWILCTNMCLSGW